MNKLSPSLAPEDYSSIHTFIQSALREDTGEGDHTSQACIPKGMKGKARLLIKEQGILAGEELAQLIFRETDPSLVVTTFLKDGTAVVPGDCVLEVSGEERSILLAERLVLNCMQRMSGIATATRTYTRLISHTRALLLDTRKTTPGMRLLEKWAVRIGGGCNHRNGLYDMILIKDNHVDYAGGIRQAIQAARKYLQEIGKDLKIEIEVRNMRELQEALDTGQIDRILLDNFTPEGLKNAIDLIGNRYETEASGGITQNNIAFYAETGVTYISVGALTHSIKSLDMSLKAVQ
ncbi:MAG TPA: carboxylating nicotinate-nucleotide diphosphorylase [Bacteroidia bacterium]|jgi:nicotinate-nucleotide pyrophosphorylase (carboxylating)|nr:carboxylating nicotinate-nucleotide diphosphorylase [Bacteroidia bacterium]